jgi:hypothetical protein
MTDSEEPAVVLVEQGIDPAVLRRLVERDFEDPTLRDRVRELTHLLIGEGEPLP